MYNAVVIFLDLVAVLGNLGAFIILLKGWTKAFSRDTKFLFIGLLCASTAFSLLRITKWSGINMTLEGLEDLIGALTPLLWAFIFYAMTQDIVKKDIIESRERYHTLVENIDLGITLVDTDHNIVMTNSGLGKLLNCDVSELAGKKCYNEFEKRQEMCLHCPGEKTMLSGQSESVETEIIRNDGNSFLASIRAFPLFHENGKSAGFIEVIEDITERKKTERALRTIIEASSTSIGPEFFRSLVKAIAIALEFKYAFIGKLKNIKPVSILTLAVWAGNDFADNFEYDLAGTPCENIIKKKSCFYTNNAQTDFPQDVLLKTLGVESYFGVPLLDSTGQILGLLTVMDSKPIFQGISRIESILTIFASRVSSELERLKNEQELINIAKFPSEDPNPVLRISSDGTILYHNKAALSLIDPSVCKDADVTIKLLNDYVSKSLKSAKTLLGEFNCCGTIYALTFAPFPESDYVNAYGLNITARKLVEEELHRSEEKFRGLVESSSDWIWEVDSQGFYSYASPQVEDILGYKPEEMVGKKPFDLMPEAEKARIENILCELVSTGKPIVTLENVNLHKDGRLIVLETSGLPIFDESGKVVGYRGVDRDITERKKNEQKIRESEEYLQSLFRAAPTGIGVLTDRVFMQANEQLCKMTGYSKEELIGKDARMIYPSDEEYEYVGHEKYAQIQDHGTGTVETKWKCKDGRIIDVLLSSTPMDLNDLSKGVTFTALDITDRKESEREKQRLNRELAVKNKELESILYAASHDLKSPLVNLQGFSHELSQSCNMVRSALAGRDTITTKMEKTLDIALNKDIPNALDYILSSTIKMDSLLAGLLDICRLTTSTTMTQPIDMNALISDVTKSLEYQINQACAEVKIEPLPVCIGNELEINRMFTNFLSNALKFLDPARPGKIRISGKTIDHQSIYCIEDNGIGIAQEHQEKIFEIFYRLDPEKKNGDGIGLTIVKRVVEKHNGKVWLESEVGKGTKFFVSLPNI